MKKIFLLSLTTALFSGPVAHAISSPAELADAISQNSNAGSNEETFSDTLKKDVHALELFHHIAKIKKTNGTNSLSSILSWAETENDIQNFSYVNPVKWVAHFYISERLTEAQIMVNQGQVGEASTYLRNNVTGVVSKLQVAYENIDNEAAEILNRFKAMEAVK